MEYLEPWQAENSSTFVDELQRELPIGHQLFGVPVVAIARRNDRDDVLFSRLDGSSQVALVHMTWAVESSPIYPHTELFESLLTWSETRMKADHAEFTA